MESVSDVVPETRIAEPGLDRIVDFSRIPGIGEVMSIQYNIGARQRLQMAVSDVQFPPLDILKKTDAGDVHVVGGGMIPTKERITINAKSRPAEMFAEQNFRGNSGRTRAG